MMDVDVVQGDKIEIQLDGPLWARMAGFPFWPARLCDSFEEASMKTPKSVKVKQVCVLFLGTRCDKAWVLESSVSPFTAANLQANFLIKKFKGDKDYRAAVVEAVRLIQRRGEIVDETFLELLKTCQNVFPLVLDASDCCVECGGSSMSGQLMSCHLCEARKLHWACCPRQEEGAWMCDDCCKLQNLPVGTLVPFETTEPPPADTSLLPNLCFLSSLSKPNKAIAGVQPTAKLPVQKNGASKESSLLKKASAALKNTADPMYTNGMATPVSSKDSLFAKDLQLHSALSSPENGTGPRAADLSGIDDECLVCGLGGHLVLCDFPHCTRAYHQICVARLFPESLDSTYTDLHNSSSNSTNSTSFGPHGNSLTGGNDVWFCPCHTCIGCHALQYTATTLATIDLPVRLLSQQLAAVDCGFNLPSNVNGVNSAVLGSDTNATTSVTNPETLTNITTTDSNAVAKPTSHNRHQLRQKPLRNCTNCPFAVCGDCETVLGEGCGVLHPKKGSEALECLNCSSRDPRLKFARLLEKAWVKCANSRLALPFLRPLLPLPASLVASTVESAAMHAGMNEASANLENSPMLRVESATSLNIACSNQSTHDTNNTNNNSQDYWVDTTVVSEIAPVGKNGTTLSKNTTPIAARGKRRQNPVDIVFTNHDVCSQSSKDLRTTEESGANKRRRSENTEEPTIKPTLSSLSKSVTTTSRPEDLLGVLEKIHRTEYTTVREYYSDINYIRNALQSRIDSCASQSTATATSSSAKQDSIMMAYDTAVDASFHYLTSKMLQVQKYESKIVDSVVSATTKKNSSKIITTISVEKVNSCVAPVVNIHSEDVPSAPTIMEQDVSMTVDPDTTLPTTSADTNCSTESTATTVTTTAPASRGRGRPRLSTTNNPNQNSSAHSGTTTTRNTIVPTASVISTMLRLWRVESAHAVPSTILHSILSTSRSSPNKSDAVSKATNIVYSSSVHILPRSLLSWRHFVENGSFPTQFRGRNDPYSVKTQIQQEERQFKSNSNAQYQVREMMYGCGDPEFAKYATNEMEAAQLMLGMTHSQQRESLSLFEGAPGIVSHNSNSSSSGGDTFEGCDGLVVDDSLLILDRLREVTQKAVQLEERLRQQHVAQRRALLHSDTDTVTIGQASIITELKLANDNLRWRLQQKQSVVLAQQSIISDLQSQLGEYKSRNGNSSGGNKSADSNGNA